MRIVSKFSEEEVKRRIISRIKVTDSRKPQSRWWDREEMIGEIRADNTFWIQKIEPHVGKRSGRRYFAGKITTDGEQTVIEGKFQHGTAGEWVLCLLVIGGAFLYAYCKKRPIVALWAVMGLVGLPMGLLTYASEESEVLLFLHQVAEAEELPQK